MCSGEDLAVDDKGRRSGHAKAAPFLLIRIDVVAVAVLAHTGSEGRQIEIEGLGVTFECRNRRGFSCIPFVWFVKQRLVHLPVVSLLARALGRLGSEVRLGVGLADREIFVDVEDLTGIDILGLELRVRRTDVAAAERSAIVRELDDGDRRVRIALRSERLAGQL